MREGTSRRRLTCQPYTKAGGARLPNAWPLRAGLPRRYVARGMRWEARMSKNGQAQGHTDDLAFEAAWREASPADRQELHDELLQSTAGAAPPLDLPVVETTASARHGVGVPDQSGDGRARKPRSARDEIARRKFERIAEQWCLLVDAVDYAEARRPRRGWAMIRQWHRIGNLPIRGDWGGRFEVPIPRGWLDHLAFPDPSERNESTFHRPAGSSGGNCAARVGLQH